MCLMLCVVSNQEIGVNMVLAWVLGQGIRNGKLCRLILSYSRGAISMIEQDTIKLLRECDAGVKMGVASIDDVLESSAQQSA